MTIAKQAAEVINQLAKKSEDLLDNEFLEHHIQRAIDNALAEDREIQKSTDSDFEKAKETLFNFIKSQVVYPRNDYTKDELSAFCLKRCNELDDIRLALLHFLLEK